jgi:peptidoglycan/LPS O-acetylase OafA/YrhL
VTDVVDRPALQGLQRLQQRRAVRPSAKMGYQPALDGVRAISVIAVILYHAGFSWMHGGFFGVEVFFVVSGFLITSLLLEERESTGTTRLAQFWFRRFRRLLPAAFTMMIAVGVWVALFGNQIHRSDLRRDYPWSLLYVANWGQIFGEVPYDVNLSPLRHLWSLAVEEQFYLLWPLAFVAMMAVRSPRTRHAAWLAGVVVVSMVSTSVVAWGGDLAPTTANFLYLSSLTRASGLLLGCAAAFVWRPWQASRAPAPQAGRLLDVGALVALALLVWSFVRADLDDPDAAVYRWNLPLVTVASLVLALVAVHPASSVRRVLAARPLAEVGKRSYGLYLWSWPISVGVRAYNGTWGRFVAAMALAAVVSEVCYRWVETPIRKGALGRWWARRPQGWTTIAACAGVATVALVVPATMYYATADKVTIAEDLRPVEDFRLPGAGALPSGSVPPSSAESSVVVPASTLTAPPAAPPVSSAVLPRRVVIVGDSMANSVAINLPPGVESTFRVTNGSVEGCGVYDRGRAQSSRDGYERPFAGCKGWQQEWAESSRQGDAEVALVMLGAWDVFDLRLDDRTLTFGSPEADQYFLESLDSGVEALKAQGVHVALLEVPCMRPKDVDGAGTPALPERGDDARVAHLNGLLRQAAAADPVNVTFVAGPAEWCTNEEIASDLGYRWDGVHVYKPGAKLIIESIAPALLAIPVAAR